MRISTNDIGDSESPLNCLHTGLGLKVEVDNHGTHHMHPSTSIGGSYAVTLLHMDQVFSL